MTNTRWAVLLAGGSGTRLLPLTRRLCGDDRPKQFAPVLGGRTLLALTRDRLSSVIPPDRTLFTVVESHRRHYATELFDVDSSAIVVQPFNRGTAAAIVYSLLRIMRKDPDAIVVFFPTDHYYADESAFCRSMANALDQIQRHERFLILVGARPDQADADYGWIEPGSRTQQTSSSAPFHVSRFLEKPSPSLARDLHRAGCLLNTFVMMGRARTFIELCDRAAPGLLQVLAPLSAELPPARERKTALSLYRKLAPYDFSHHVLAKSADRLLVVPLEGEWWSDLGTEGRVHAVLARLRLAKAAGHENLNRGDLNNSEVFRDWLANYRKHLGDFRHPPAARTSGQGSGN